MIFITKNKSLMVMLVATVLTMTGCDRGVTTDEHATTDTEQAVTDANANKHGIATPSRLQSLTNSFVGCYSSDKNTKQPELMITQENDEYYVALNTKEGWDKEPKPLAYADKSNADLQKLFNEDIKYLEDALYTPEGAFGLFKISDAANGNMQIKDPDSEYIVFLLLGAAPAYSVACP